MVELWYCRFCMGRPLFMRILAMVEAHDKWFVQRRDSVGRLGHSALVKVTAAHRMLAYGCPADALDESLHSGESTMIQSV